MNGVHIYRAAWQPLTEHYDSALDRTITLPKRRVYRCHECRDWRWAKYLKIQVFYDHVRIQCADGCYGENRNHRKDPERE